MWRLSFPSSKLNATPRARLRCPSPFHSRISNCSVMEVARFMERPSWDSTYI